jgi:2-polyprenyl-3-methyl-5-hydroxy-6-metoxy-1,4-benzoquinol methylase
VSHRSHYSYTHYAEPVVAEGFDRLRFGGPIGQLVAEAQARVLLEFAGTLPGQSVADIGAGTGRGALLLAGLGAKVTGMDASSEMLRVGVARARSEGLDVQFVRGDAHALPYPDRAFETVVCLRVLMHTPGWRRCLAELCRIARGRVIVDYPALVSVAALQSLGRRALHAVGLRTEAYRVFADRAIARLLADAGFRVVSRHRQFAVPIAVHKALGSRGFTERTERLLDRLRVTALVGSPVTLLAERCER